MLNLHQGVAWNQLLDKKVPATGFTSFRASLNPRLSANFAEWRESCLGFVNPERVRYSTNFRDAVQGLVRPDNVLRHLITSKDYLQKVMQPLLEEDWTVDPGTQTGLPMEIPLHGNNLGGKRAALHDAKQALIARISSMFETDMMCSLLGAQCASTAWDLDTPPRECSGKSIAMWTARTFPQKDCHLNMIELDNKSPGACFTPLDVTTIRKRVKKPPAEDRAHFEQPPAKRQRTSDAWQDQPPTRAPRHKSSKKVVRGFENALCYNCNLLGHTTKHCDMELSDASKKAMQESKRKRSGKRPDKKRNGEPDSTASKSEK